jgi:hypothetical protein
LVKPTEVYYTMKKLSTSADTKEIAVTIYNDGFGAVKEKRTVNISESDNELIFADVAQMIETDSLIVEGLNILEFNYDFDLVNKSKLLLKYIDKEVFLKDRTTRDMISCRLLSIDNDGQCVFENNESKEIYIDTQLEIVLPSLPSGLLVKPALVWKIANSNTNEVNVSYLSKGFTWNANYVVELKNSKLNIIGWAEVNNISGMTYKNSKIKLIAGDVNRIESHNITFGMRESAAPTYSAAEEKVFFDYHMYTLKSPTTLKDNQTKQISILSQTEIPFKQYYKLDLYEKKADVIIEFANTCENGLGLAFPKGKIKIYKEDEADNSLEFIGEDKIGHTPKDEIIKLAVGKAFDITFEYKEIDKMKIADYEHYKYECVVKNHKDIDVEIRFEPYVWGNWKMVESSHKYNKKSSSQLEYIVSVPTDSETKIQFEFKIDKRTE